MILAVASGKGGTGKTTVSVSLAALLAQDGPTTLVDLDVEAPNAHLFVEPHWQEQATQFLPVPVVDESRCTRCAACSDLCQFKAIAVLGDVIVTFDPMCHGCGGCWTVCPEQCISQGRRELGESLVGHAVDVDGLRLAMGRLRIGEAMSPPLMKRVMKLIPSDGDVIIDAPPGTSCPAMTATSFADALLMVTEPTPFGLYDLSLAVQALRPMNKPMGVVINRAGMGDDRVLGYCREQGLPILAEIPFDKEIARGYSNGKRLEQSRPALIKTLKDVIAHFKVQLSGNGDGASPGGDWQ